jgi:hypothetical protein
MSHGIRKLTEDNYHAYYESEHGIKVVSHSEDWQGYYRLGEECDMILTAFCYGKSPGVIKIPIRTHEDLQRLGYKPVA